MSVTETVTQKATELVDYLFLSAENRDSINNAYENRMRGKVRAKIARVAWRMALERRTELTNRQWEYLRERFTFFCHRERYWNDPSRDLAPAIPEFPLSFHHEDQSLSDMLETTKTQLAEDDPNPENLLSFAYEIDPLDVYLADEVPNKTVAEFLAAHPLTDGELLAQAGEELPTHFLLLAAHPNFPSESVSRSNYNIIVQKLISHNQCGRVFTELWEQGCYDWDKLQSLVKNDYEYPNIYRALGNFGTEDTLREILQDLDTTNVRPFLDGVIHRPAPLEDVAILAELLRRNTAAEIERYGHMNYLQVKELWVGLLSRRDLISVAEIDLLLRFGTDHLTFPDRLALWMVEDEVLKVTARSTPEKALAKFLKGYPTNPVATVPDFSDHLMSAEL